MRRQALNVFRMPPLEPRAAVTAGTATLKDATSEAIRRWVTQRGEHSLTPRLRAGPHP